MATKYSAHPVMFRNNPLGFILAVALIPAAIGIIILMVWYLRCKATRLEFTGDDLVLERGLLSKNRTEPNWTWGVSAPSMSTSRFSTAFLVSAESPSTRRETIRKLMSKACRTRMIFAN